MTIHQAIMNILEQHQGSNNRIPRKELRRQVSQALLEPISDRLVRNVIEELRTSDPRGSLICSTVQGGGGYWIAWSLQELDHYLHADENRLKSLAVRIREQRKRAGLAESKQLSLF